MFTKKFCYMALSILAFPLAANGQIPPGVDLNPLAQPPDPALLRPVERVPRRSFGVVGPFPLTEQDLRSLFYPSASAADRAAALEGLTFFTTAHTPQEGAGPIANQPFCLGCHMNSAEVPPRDLRGNRLVTTVSQVSRAARTTPTNFDFTGFDPATGGGRPADFIDAINNTGRTAAFTQFGLFSAAMLTFNGLTQFSSNSVQHTRPSIPECLPDPLPWLLQPNLDIPAGFRRTTGERAGPPYIGRGLIEAVAESGILGIEAAEKQPAQSSLDVSATFPECGGNCAAGRHNMNTSNQAFVGGDPTPHVGRFGLRAQGPFILQFITGGLQGELSFTSEFNGAELFSAVNVNRPGCPAPTVSMPGAPPLAPGQTPEEPVTTPLSERVMLRLTAPPEFGEALLKVLNSQPIAGLTQPVAFTGNDGAAFGADAGRARRGAELFGIDLAAFANRMIPGRMPSGGDGLDPNAINQADRQLNCVGCHTPVMATGVLSPGEPGTEHISNVWAPLFSDLLLHKG
ncbi:MAG: hypothetical protein JO110_01025, partial [Acetobacteraceae bacterium]|nr:hypothetical protein [Acetobacteraceae bacterium]